MRSTLMLGLALAMMVVTLAVTEETKVVVAMATTNTAEVAAVRDPSTTVKDMRVGVFPVRDDDRSTRFDPAKLSVEWHAPGTALPSTAFDVSHAGAGLETIHVIDHRIVGDGPVSELTNPSPVFVNGNESRFSRNLQARRQRPVGLLASNPERLRYPGSLLRIHRHGAGRFAYSSC